MGKGYMGKGHMGKGHTLEEVGPIIGGLLLSESNANMIIKHILMRSTSLVFKIILLFGGMIATSANGYSQTSQTQLISPNKIWEYIENKWTSSSDPQYPADNIMQVISKIRYEFGDTEDAYGKTYSRWILKDIESWCVVQWWEDPGADAPDFDYASYTGPYEHFSDWTHEFREIGEPVALIREEDGKVYKLLDDEDLIYYHDRKLEDITAQPGEELLLFDITANYKQSFQMLGDGLYVCTGLVADVFDYNDMGQNLRGIGVVTDYGWAQVSKGSIEEMWENKDFLNSMQTKFLEGIGVVSGGTLTDAYIRPLVLPTCLCYSLTDLLRVTDNNTTIYENPQAIPEISAIRDIKSDIKSSNSVIYDLFGREIMHPQPGTVYIRNGKKFVGK